MKKTTKNKSPKNQWNSKFITNSSPDLFHRLSFSILIGVRKISASGTLIFSVFYNDFSFQPWLQSWVHNSTLRVPRKAAYSTPPRAKVERKNHYKLVEIEVPEAEILRTPIKIEKLSLRNRSGSGFTMNFEFHRLLNKTTAVFNFYKIKKWTYSAI